MYIVVAFISNVITFLTVLHLQLMGHGGETIQIIELEVNVNCFTVLY